MIRSCLVLIFCSVLFPGGPVFARQASITALPADLLQDGQSLVSRHNALLLLGGTAATLVALQIEDPEGAHRALDHGVFDSVADFGNIYGEMQVQGSLALGSWAVGYLSGSTKIEKLGYDLTRSLLLTYAVTGILKHSIDRTRPNGKELSFPSGHTSAAFATAGVLSRHYGAWGTGVGVGLGIVTGAGRMEDKFHYASDVIAGATIGWIIGRTVGQSEILGVSGLQVLATGSRVGIGGMF